MTKFSYKKLFVLLVAGFILTGCTVKNINLDSTDDVIDTVLSSETQLNNQYFKGYKYYLPREVAITNMNGYNTIMQYNNNKMYLYIDLIAYYHKINREYDGKNDIYYSKELNYGKKKGYINIEKVKGEYYIYMYYNYGHMQALVKKEDINKTVMQMSYILKSIKYNNTIIESLIGENKIEYQEEKFNLFKSDNDNDSYLNIIKDKDKKKETDKEDDLKDEDDLKITIKEDNDLED